MQFGRGAGAAAALHQQQQQRGATTPCASGGAPATTTTSALHQKIDARTRPGARPAKPTGAVRGRPLVGSAAGAPVRAGSRGASVAAARPTASAGPCAAAGAGAGGGYSALASHRTGTGRRGGAEQRRAWNGFLGLALAVSVAAAGVGVALRTHRQTATGSASMGAAKGRVTASAAAASGAEGGGALADEEMGYRPGTQVRLLALVPDGGSPFGGAPWRNVAAHLRQRVRWFGEAPGRFDLAFLTEAQLAGEDGLTLLGELGVRAQAIVAFDVSDAGAVSTLTRYLKTALRRDQVFVSLGGGADASLQPLASFAGFKPTQARPGLLTRLAPWIDPVGTIGAKVYETVGELYARRNSDDLMYTFLVLTNAYVERVPEVANSIEGSSFQTLACMLTKCGKEVVTCVRDDGCGKALSCLQNCKFNDQVCSYRCIASYESPLLEAFSLCILQKHNCLGLDAQPPALPDPAPMASFRGLPMSHELAEDLFVGWFDGDRFAPSPSPAAAAATTGSGGAASSGAAGSPSPLTSARNSAGGGERLPFSWRVAAGKNPAYDYFPCQFQLFYRGKAKNSMWYDPIFKVKTLDGREVWRERHYRVRRGQAPGTFHLSVLDNGVTSKEFWRIVDCDDALGWCLFYYSGAASVAGVSYSGAILATRDGGYPPESDMPRVEAALDRAGIKRWELSSVDNSACNDAPLRPLSEVAPRQLAVL